MQLNNSPADDSSISVETELVNMDSVRRHRSSYEQQPVFNDNQDNSVNNNDSQLAADGSKKRKRGDSSSVSISCELCKARKVKCDRAEPACGWCARNNRTCIYEVRKKPGIRVDYGRELEEKIKTLEATLHLLGRRVEDHIASHEAQIVTREQPWTPILGYSNAIPATGQTGPPNNQLRDVEVQGAEFQGSETQGIAPENAPAPNYLWTSSVEATPTVFTPSMRQSDESDFPPRDMLYTLVDLYFKHVNPWSPILDRKATFDALFHKVMDEADRILLHAIVATTMKFLKDSRLTSELRNHYYNIAKQKVQLYGLENPNVRALQALVILALDVLGTSNGPSGWNLLALIARNIVQLGLSVEKSVFLTSPTHQAIDKSQAFFLPQPSSWIENEGRRRLSWMTYVLDRYATVATSFDFILDDKDMDRPLPCRYDLFSKNEPVETKWVPLSSPLRSNITTINRTENLGSFSYHCEVLTILSRIDKFLKQPIDIDSYAEIQDWRESYRTLDGELSTWLQSLPSEYGKISQLCHSDPASRISNWIMLHAAFVTSVIRLHSAAAYPTLRSTIFTSSHTAMQRCLSAVESLREIVQDVIDTGMLDLLGHPLAFSLWVSARVLLVHGATMECEVDPKIRFFITSLAQMGQFWGVAQSYADTLNSIVEEAANGRPNALSTMRQCGYDLSLLISERPRTVLNPMSIRIPSPHEIEYLDVFDFFNYPRLTPNSVVPNMIIKTGAPNPDADWLVFKPPYD